MPIIVLTGEVLSPLPKNCEANSMSRVSPIPENRPEMILSPKKRDVKPPAAEDTYRTESAMGAYKAEGSSEKSSKREEMRIKARESITDAPIPRSEDCMAFLGVLSLSNIEKPP